MRFLVFSLLFLTAIYVSEARSLSKRDTSYYEDVDVKALLLKQVGEIYDQAHKAVETLAKTGKAELKNGLEKTIAFIQSVADKVKTLKPTTDQGKVLLKLVEQLAEQGVTILKDDLKKVGVYETDANKEALLKTVGEIVDEAKAAFDKLKNADKKTLIDALQKVVDLAKEIETDLKTLHPTTDLGKVIFDGVSSLVVEIRGFLEADIKKLSGFYYDDTQDQLKQQIENLKKMAHDAIEKLKAQGKGVLAEGIKKLEEHLVDLEQQLEKLNPQTDIGKTLLKTLETLVKNAEQKLEEEIKKLTGSYYEDVDVKAVLLKQVGEIYDQAKKAIETLAKSGKAELKNGLEKTIAFIQTVADKVKTLKPTTDEGKVLLKLVEKLAEQGVTILTDDLKKVGVFEADANKEALLKTVGEIIDEAKAAFEKLKNADKKTLVAALQKVVDLAKEIETDLKTLHPTTDVGKVIFDGVTSLVVEIRGVLEADIKKLSGFYYDDTQDQLKQQIENLKKMAHDAIEKLKAQGKGVLAEGIKKLEEHLVDLEQQLEKLNPQTEIGKTLLKTLETLVKNAEQKLEEEIKKLTGSYYDDTQDDLKNKLEELKKKAQEAIQKLMAEGKTVLAEGIKRLENQLMDLESQLEKLNPQTEIGKTLLKALEGLVKSAEEKLEEELKKLSGSFYDDTQDELKKQIENLRKQAKEAIEKLKAQGKAVLAEGIKQLEEHLGDLEAQLEKLNPNTEAGKALLKALETLIKDVEQKLQDEIKKLTGSYYEDVDVKAVLLKQVGEIYDQAKKAIETLAKSGKAELKNGLEKTIAFIQTVADKVKTLKPTTDEGKVLLKLVEKLAEQGVTILTDDLKKVGVYETDANKEALLKTVGEIIDEAKAAFDKLKNADKKTLVAALQKVVDLAKEIETDLKTLHPTTDVGKVIFDGVSSLVVEIRGVLEADIKKLSGFYYDTNELKDKLELLKKLAHDTIEKLKAQGKTALAEGIEKLEAHLIDLEQQLSKLNPQTVIGKLLLETLETLVKDAEQKLEEEMKKLNGSYYDDTQDELKKQIENLKKMAHDAIEKLKAQGKAALAAGIEKLEAQLVDLEQQLEKLNPQTEVGKAILKTLETLIKNAEQKLEEEIKKLTGSF